METYNFTIDENTSFDEELSIDPEMLGRIFENLLAEINPETGESARKSTGSYYTPRVIVDYMIDESLLLYLKQQTQIDEEKLRSVLSYDLRDDEENPLTENERERIITALEKVKILDPACGSGAFPIGALQKIVFILQQADPEGHLWFKKQIKNTSPELRKVVEREFAHKNFDYIRKLGIIRENIYGVDIQPIATEISRLRCFLTLVVDERIQEDLENRGIEPLPNLDFKFVTANSLIGLPGSQKNSQIGLFEDAAGISELKELRDMFFTASGAERDQLKLQFVQAQNRMFQRLISENRRGHADLTTKLSTWDPFSHKSSSWFDPEWMFGISSGFSIVIGNPPYVQLQKSEGILADLYSDQGYETFARTGDIYTLFYEKGVLVANTNTGIICFITSNKWMRAGYGKQMRKFLLNKTQPIGLIDFGDFSVFETATVDTCIFLGRRGKYGGAFIAAHCTTADFSNMEGLGEYVRSKQVQVLPEELDPTGETSWYISSSEELHLKQKIELKGKPLKEWKVKMRRGIVTGCNEAFIIDEATKNSLIAIDDKNRNIIKPFLLGRDVKRYKYEWKHNYLLFLPWHFPLHENSSLVGNSMEAQIAFKKEYTAIFNHVIRFKEQLSNRNKSETGIRYEWYVLQRWGSDYYKEFENEKIVWGNLALKPQFALVEPGMYINAPSAFINSGSRYLLAILNSKVSNFYIKTQGVTRSGGYIEFKPMFIERIPIPIPDYRNNALINNIEQLCQEIIDVSRKEPLADISNIESKIDQLVYKLYDLTEDEIKLVEGKITGGEETETILVNAS